MSAKGADPERRDAEARRLAQTDFSAPLLLEAGAGTGKTAVLVARIVAWCLGPGWERAAASEPRPAGDAAVASRVLRGVVAITFTDAATAEMAERIAGAFERVRRGDLPVGVDADVLPPPIVRAARAAAFRLALDQLRVHTIHAFCLRLLLAHPLEAGVHPRLRVDADGQAVAAAVREAMEEALPRAFGPEPDARWLRLGAGEIGPREIEAALIALLGEGVTAAELSPSAAAAGRARAFAAGLREALAAFCAAERGRLAAVRGAPGLAAAAEAIHAAAAIAERDLDLEALCAALVALPGWDALGERIGKLASGDFGARGLAALGDDAGAVAARAAALAPFVTHVARLDGAGYEDARSVLAELAERVEARLRRSGVATFGALLRGARDLLRDDEVRRRERAELTQLLVDEFQDTDALQCEILRALALDEPERPRPVLFLVGDPKQSIYGWRNADLRAYQALRDELAGRVFPLVVNFRSAPPILDEVTRLVEPVMEPEPGLQPRFEPLLASPRTRGSAGYTTGGRAPVEHWLAAQLDAATGELAEPASAEERAEQEARAAAADLAALRADGVSLGRTAILLRVTAAFEPVLAALREAGLPYVVERETDFYQRREILDVVALVRAVLDPLDALALVATLRSSVAGVPDAAWLPLWRETFPARAAAIDGRDETRREEARAAARRAAAALPPDVPDAHVLAGWPDALDDFLCALHELRGAYERETSERFVERLRERVLFEASEAGRHLGEHRVANLDRFFRDLVLALDEAAGSAASLVAFLRRAGSVAREHAEGRPRAASEDAVNVLTIHRAKGLDWDHVYLLGVDRGHRREDRRETAVLRRGAEVGFVLFGRPEPGLPVLAAERADVEAAERVRLLYVATTRAKERLVLGARRREAKPWRQARSFAELLPARRGAPLEWDAVAHAGAAGLAAEPGVLRRVVAVSEGAPAAAERGGPALAAPAEAERDEQRLRALRAEAARWAERPFSTTASEEVHAREQRAEAAAGEGAAAAYATSAADPGERSTAQAAGTAVHALLESGGLAADDAALARAVAAAATPGEREAVRARAHEVWRAFLAGPLAARLSALAPHVVARELSVWLEPPADGPGVPTGFVAGAIDLLYRDPETGELVVADYKTDDVAGAALEERAAGYAGQGAVYTRAVERALGLAARPRFELWFLRAGEVRVVPT